MGFGVWVWGEEGHLPEVRALINRRTCRQVRSSVGAYAIYPCVSASVCMYVRTYMYVQLRIYRYMLRQQACAEQLEIAEKPS